MPQQGNADPLAEGLREAASGLRTLGDKVDSVRRCVEKVASDVHAHDVQDNERFKRHDEKFADMERRDKDRWDRLEKSMERKGERHWQMWVLIIGAVCMPVVIEVAKAIFSHK